MLSNRDKVPDALSRTATWAKNGAEARYSAALREYKALFLSGPSRSVNRKVQGSNPGSGAKIVLEESDRPRSLANPPHRAVRLVALLMAVGARQPGEQS